MNTRHANYRSANTNEKPDNTKYHFSFGAIVGAATVALTLSMCGHAHAEEAMDKYEFCGALSVAAEGIMQSRQAGTSMQYMVDKVMGASDNEDAQAIFVAMIQDAYALPRFNTSEYQRNAVGEFQNDVYGACLEVRE